MKKRSKNIGDEQDRREEFEDIRRAIEDVEAGRTIDTFATEMGAKLRIPTTADLDLAEAAKAIVVLAFRNGPLEDLHAGILCPTCSGDSRYSKISDTEIRTLMKNAVDVVFTLLKEQRDDPRKWRTTLELAANYTKDWDEPA